jgi:DNA-directed RNA polymerase subunit RPC12/RpoP
MITLIDCTVHLDPSSPIVNIPIHQTKSNTTSTQPNLIDFERRTDRIRPCLVCKRNFDDSRSTSVCATCDQKMKYTSVPRQPLPIRYPSTANYAPSYIGSDFISRVPAMPKVRGLQKVVCPHCKNFNMVHVTSDRMDYNCSICGTHLRLANVHG